LIDTTSWVGGVEQTLSARLSDHCSQSARKNASKSAFSCLVKRARNRVS
jgi:hypothetical protein